MLFWGNSGNSVRSCSLFRSWSFERNHRKHYNGLIGSIWYRVLWFSGWSLSSLGVCLEQESWWYIFRRRKYTNFRWPLRLNASTRTNDTFCQYDTNPWKLPWIWIWLVLYSSIWPRRILTWSKSHDSWLYVSKCVLKSLWRQISNLYANWTFTCLSLISYLPNL